MEETQPTAYEQFIQVIESFPPAMKPPRTVAVVKVPEGSGYDLDRLEKTIAEKLGLPVLVLPAGITVDLMNIPATWPTDDTEDEKPGNVVTIEDADQEDERLPGPGQEIRLSGGAWLEDEIELKTFDHKIRVILSDPENTTFTVEWLGYEWTGTVSDLARRGRLWAGGTVTVGADKLGVLTNLRAFQDELMLTVIPAPGLDLSDGWEEIASFGHMPRTWKKR